LHQFENKFEIQKYKSANFRFPESKSPENSIPFTTPVNIMYKKYDQKQIIKRNE